MGLTRKMVIRIPRTNAAKKQIAVSFQVVRSDSTYSSPYWARSWEMLIGYLLGLV